MLTPSITLYGSRLSPFVEKVARALHYKKQPFRHVDLKSPLDLGRWNPQTRKMPVLEIDGRKDYDSTFLLRWIDELWPDPPLFSADPAVMLRQRHLEDWSDESLYFYVFSLRWTDRNAPATVAQLGSIVPWFLRPIAGFVFHRQIKPLTHAQGLGRLPVGRLVSELERRLDELVVLLGESPYFYSDTPSAADLAIFGQFSTLRSGATPDGAALLDERPALQQWYDRVAAATAH
jgi:glutathione S-transferase